MPIQHFEHVDATVIWYDDLPQYGVLRIWSHWFIPVHHIAPGVIRPFYPSDGSMNMKCLTSLEEAMQFIFSYIAGGEASQWGTPRPRATREGGLAE